MLLNTKEKTICKVIKENIKVGTKIPNWSMKGNIRVPYYEVVAVSDMSCTLLQPITKKTCEVSESSFQFMIKNWKDYLGEKIARNELRDGNQQTTYTICVLHYLYEKHFLN